MKIKLSDNFTYKRLLRFVVPTICMMIFTSIYGVVDGFFVTNLVGKTAFAAVNLIMPFLMILGSIGFMIGTGGTAIVSKTIGTGNRNLANRYFSMLIAVTAVSGVSIAVLGELALPYVIRLLKATEDMYDYCLVYGRIILVAVPFFMLQNVFQAFFTTAEKPTLGFIMIFIAGCTNIVLDAVFVGLFKFGIIGAAVATSVSQFVGGVAPFAFFISKRPDTLHICKPVFDFKVLLNTCTNGVSEFVGNISASLVSMVFNFQLLRLAGQDGVACYGVMMYVNFIYIAVFIGYAIATAPIIGYNFGANNKAELKNVFKKSMVMMAIFGTGMTLLAILLAQPIAKIFVGYDESRFNMTKNAFYIYSVSFLFTGFAIFTSSLFTALGNGLISAIVSILRTLVFQIVCVLILPILWGVTGIWLSMTISEILALTTSVIMLMLFRKKYGYI